MAPAEWSDVWLNEGHATWYEALYADRKFGVSMLDRLHTFYELGNQYRADFGPVALPSSNDFLNETPTTSTTAACWCCTRSTSGSAGSRSTRSSGKWAQRNRGESVSTEDFIAHAAKVAGDRSLVPFLREWVYGTTIPPPMPGHPDWSAAPASAVAASASAGRIGAAGGSRAPAC